MGRLSSTLRYAEGMRLTFWCLGCDMAHQIAYGPPNGPEPRWSWDGHTSRPTFKPSILVRYDHLSEASAARNKEFYEANGRHMTSEELPYDVHEVCHSFVTNGQMQYLADCTHSLAGQTVPLPPFTDWD